MFLFLNKGGHMNYYEILGIGKNASLEDIKRARNGLLRELHPDNIEGLINKYKDDPTLQTLLQRQKIEAHARTTQINEAFNTLSDPSKRSQYDQRIFPGITMPRAADLGKIMFGEIKHFAIAVENKSSVRPQYSLIQLKNMPSGLVVTFGSKDRKLKYPVNIPIEPDFPFYIVISVRGEAEGSFAANIKFTFDNTIFDFPITYQVIHPAVITADITNFNLGVLLHGEHFGKIITLSNTGGKPQTLELSWVQSGQNTPDLPPPSGWIFPLQILVDITSTQLYPGNHRNTLLIQYDNKSIAVRFDFVVIAPDDVHQEDFSDDFDVWDTDDSDADEFGEYLGS
jgi:hypothetical protein